MEVTADDLTKPLGLEERRSRLPAIRVPVAPILAGLLIVGLGGAAAYVTFVDDPLAGEPHAIVPIEIAAAPPAAERKDDPAPPRPGGATRRRSKAPPGSRSCARTGRRRRAP